MSEGIVIALIGFVGAVLGAAIAGFATVTAAGIKGKGEGSISCGLVGLLASLGAAGGLVLGAVFGASLMQQKAPPQQPALASSPTQMPSLPQLVQTPTISAGIQPLPQPTTGYIPTCNWARDWQLQPDGSYLWIGLPPGSPECQNVGQDGELLRRLRNGENITLVVDVGNNFIGLSICKGNFTAAEVIPGEKCVPKNPELWPKVKGRLVVTGSDGFLVGTGK